MKFVFYYLGLSIVATGCGGGYSAPPAAEIDQLQLKKGQVVLCGPADKEFGTVDFSIGGDKVVQGDFNTAVELLHSFEYDEAEKVFAKIISESPGCVMAYWGVAMCSFHPLWEPPTEASLKKGAKAVEIGYSIRGRSDRETAWLDAVGAYYKDWSTTDARGRAVRFEKAMEGLHRRYPDDREAAIFYALALDAAASPTDASYINQKKAGRMLDSMYAAAPNHPGIIHYIIHTYDYPGIASLGLPAARRYAQVAPSSAHALHMPSHIFTRLGLWAESIQLNTRSVEAAQCYAQSTGIKGHWDEELHGLDYLVYAYLQRGDDSAAAAQLRYLSTIKEVFPVNFKEAYTFAAAPARMAIERKHWAEAARLSPEPASFPWEKYPWQAAIIHFGRLLGFVHTGDIAAGEVELSRMDSLRLVLSSQNDGYKARQVEIQVAAGKAWVAHAKGDEKGALVFMKQAADWEDSTSKHPVTPGEVLPARELYADMLMDMRQHKEAFHEYEAVLKRSPNRFNSLYGAGRSAQLTGDKDNATLYYRQLAAIADPRSDRPELKEALAFLRKG